MSINQKETSKLLWTRDRYTHNWKQNMRESSNKKTLVDLACDLGRTNVLYEEMIEALCSEGLEPARRLQILKNYRLEFKELGLKSKLFEQ